ncbi:MAG TPA: AAA family ATPase [Acetobacteraceae bacterium]|jgi:hypothetical protein
MNDLWSEWQARIDAPPEAALCALPATLPDAASIPPREWLYGTRLIPRFVSVLAAPGGVGKSALALARTVALATGRGSLGERVHHSVPVWVLNLEDPLDELHRRVAALMRLHRVPREALQGRLFLHSGRSRRVTMGTLEDSGGTADAEYVIYHLEEAGQTLLALPNTGYSTRLRTSSIDIIRSALEGYGWENQRNDKPRLRPAMPDSARIARMDEALGGIPTIPQDRYVLRRIVGARALVSPVTERHLFTWRRLGTLLGADHKAVQRWHGQGIALILAGLG